MVVKICGITTLEDAFAAVDAGAHLLGFNFYPPSPRYLTPDACRKLVADLRVSVYPSAIELVGVFVNTSPGEIARILDFCGLELAQLSGDEPPEILDALHGRAFKALRPADPASLENNLAQYPPRPEAPAYLLDAFRPGAFGGTGETGDWTLASRVARRHALLLAGGLNPDNVAAAVAAVNPWGVDVASGVESSPGRKDPVKMRAFVRAAQVQEKSRV